ncbi:MAG: serine/threonine protein kinase [Chloroflexota bacterium]|nr:serine/threonine protein kinase [Chloroflexota bacterium]
MARLLTPGTVLRGRYSITGLVGQGGMGAVYLADDLRLEGRQTAIKEIALDAYGAPDDPIAQQAREQFHREASILARLDHPNLPKVSDFFYEEGRDYLVMDYVPGRDLREILEEARAEGKFLAESKVLNWAQQIAEALSYLHTQTPPVLHRDIKPSNIKLTPTGRIKLVDFGLVKVMITDDERTVTVLQGRGTAAYTPLEQYGGDAGHTDSRSDIYSFAATLYHLLTGELPPDAKERFLHPHVLRRPRELNPHLSTETEEALLWALETHPTSRPATVTEFMNALTHGVSYENGRLTASTSWDSALLQNRRLLLLLLLLLFLALFLTWQLS